MASSALQTAPRRNVRGPPVSPQPPAPLKSAVSESSPISSSWCGHGTATRRPWTRSSAATRALSASRPVRTFSRAASPRTESGRPDRALQGSARLPRRQGDVLPGFAELCITRQIITAIKTATRFKHAPLNTYVSFSQTPAGQDDGECTLGDALPGPGVDDPAVCVISTEELQSLVFCLGTGLSSLESDALRLYLEGNSYEEMAEGLGCDTKTIDNALQRVKRKSCSTSRAAVLDD